MNLLRICFGTMVLAAACGDNGNKLEADAREPPADADPSTPDAEPQQMFAAVVAGDFANTGTLAKIDLGNNSISTGLLTGTVGTDPQIRRVGNELLVINRSENNVTILSADRLGLVDQFATGANSNPQDAVVVGNKIYVPALGTAGVVVINRMTRTNTLINLSSLDPDGKPDCNSVVATAGMVFVACGGLQADFSSLFGKVVKIDPATDTNMGVIDLPSRNPFGQMIVTPQSSFFKGDILVSTANFNDQTLGCVARVNPATSATSCAITNMSLGANPSAMAVGKNGTRLYLTPQSFGGAAPLRQLDLTTGMLIAGSLTPASIVAADVAACSDGKLIVADKKTGKEVIRVFNDSTDLTPDGLALGIKPIGGGGLFCH